MLLTRGLAETGAPVIQMNPSSPKSFKVLLPYLYAEIETEAKLSDEQIVGAAASAEYLLLPVSAHRALLDLLAENWRGVLAADPDGFNRMPSSVMRHVMERLSNRSDGGLEAFTFLASIDSKESVEMVPTLFSIGGVKETLGGEELERFFIADGKKVAAWCRHAAAIPLQQLYGCMKNEMMRLKKELKAAKDLMICVVCNKVMTREDALMAIANGGGCTRRYHPGKYCPGANRGWTCCGKPYKKEVGCQQA
ncbi:unnamed protein product, partial [Chrysoparadoxa australica]